MKYFLAILGCAALATAAAPDKDIPILKQDSDISPDGSFNFAYETGNGIAAQAAGVLKNAGNKDSEASEISGSYQYTGEDGANYAIRYVANENGYQPEGAHLPVAPPPQEIPQYIQRALDWIAAHPQPEERPGKKF